MENTDLPSFQPDNLFFLPSGIFVADRYEIKRVIGSGGFSILYQAYDHLLGGYVAIKEYFPNQYAERRVYQQRVEVRGGENQRQFDAGLIRFRNETKKTAALQGLHNVVNVLGSVEQNGTAYMVMEYLDGKTLSEYLNGLPEHRFFNLQDAQTTILAVVEALEYCHSNKIIHRDVSADNVFLCNDGSVRLIDFGNARETFDSEDSSIIIKQGCTPPEQYAKKGKQGAWTDIYALAATYYRMLTGIYPDAAPDRQKTGSDALIPPSAFNPDVPDYLDALIERCLALDYQLRIGSAAEFRRILNDHRITEKPITVQRRLRFYRTALISSSILIALLVALIGVTIWVQANTLAACTLRIVVPDHFSTIDGLAKVEEMFESKYPAVNVVIHYLSEVDHETVYAMMPNTPGNTIQSIDTVVVAYDPTLLYVNDLKLKTEDADTSVILTENYAANIAEFLNGADNKWVYRGNVFDYIRLRTELSVFLETWEDPNNAYTPVELFIPDHLPRSERRAAKKFLQYITELDAQNVLFLEASGMLPANEEARRIFFANIPNLEFLEIRKAEI